MKLRFILIIKSWTKKPKFLLKVAIVLELKNINRNGVPWDRNGTGERTGTIGVQISGKPRATKLKTELQILCCNTLCVCVGGGGS